MSKNKVEEPKNKEEAPQEEKKEVQKMEYVFLGNTGMKVSRLSLGTMTFRHPEQEDHYFAIVKQAWDRGINMFDTAELYGDKGCAEIIAGKCLKRLNVDREELIITVKIFWGADRSDPMSHNSVGLSRKHIIEGCKASLKRLQIDYADVIFAHRPDNEVPMEE